MEKMKVKSHLAHGIEITEQEAEYDESVKTLLSDKQVLARIAKYRMKEFENYDIPTIMECIEGEPQISVVPVHPGKRKSEAITGMNTESKVVNEGEVTFDVRFYMVTPEKERIKVIVNIEAQKSYYPGYYFEPRAVVYCARMISEQIDREFTTDNYDDLKKVYSIWIFFEAPLKDSDTITEYSITKKDVYGKPVEGGKYDYLSISFIRLSRKSDEESKNKLIDMLNTLFSNKIDAQTKKQMLEQKHQMEMTRELEGGINSMCNVGSGLREEIFEEVFEEAWEEGIEKGIKEGREKGIKEGREKGIKEGREKGIKEGREKGIKEGREKGILALIKVARKYNASDKEIVEQLMEEYQLDETKAMEYLAKK